MKEPKWEQRRFIKYPKPKCVRNLALWRTVRGKKVFVRPAEDCEVLDTSWDAKKRAKCRHKLFMASGVIRLRAGQSFVICGGVIQRRKVNAMGRGK